MVNCKNYIVPSDACEPTVSHSLKLRRLFQKYETQENNNERIRSENFIEDLYRHITPISCVDKFESSCEVNDICFFCGKWNKINEIKFLNDISLQNLLNYKNLALIDGDKEILLTELIKGN